jgi:hypothetical protein
MAITVERDDAQRRFYAVASGEVTLTALLAFVAEHRVGDYRQYALIFDASHATRLPRGHDIDTLVSNLLAIRAREGLRGDVAVVATGAGYGVARMYEIKCEIAGIDVIRAFQSVSDAEDWLGTRAR